MIQDDSQCFKMAECCCWSAQGGNNIIITHERKRDITGNEFTDQEFKSLGIDLTMKNHNKLYVLFVYYYFKCSACFHTNQCSKLTVFIFSY